MRNLFTFIGIAAIGLFVLNKLFNAIADSITIKDVAIKFGSLDLTGLKIQVPLTIQNNSDISIPVESFRGQIIYGAQEIAPVMINVPHTIDAHNTSVLTVDSKINFLEIAQDILDLINSGQYLNNLRLVGILTYKGIGIPIDRMITII